MITANPSHQPEEYLPKIKEELSAIARSEGHALARAIACGHLLASAHAALDEANAKLPKSKQTSWGKWLKENLADYGCALSTANVYVRLYEHKDEAGVKGAKSISEARAALPPERTPRENEDEDGDDDEDSNQLSDKDREQVASEYMRSRLIPEIYDQLVGIFDDEQLFALYQLLGQRFAKGAPATAVANQPAAPAGSAALRVRGVAQGAAP
jgi:hypothetical protein